MRISSECARSARSSSVSCQTRPSGDTLAAATSVLTRLATGGVNQPGPSSVSSVSRRPLAPCASRAAHEQGAPHPQSAACAAGPWSARTSSPRPQLSSRRESAGACCTCRLPARRRLEAGHLAAEEVVQPGQQRHPSVARRADVAKVRGPRRVPALVDEQRGERVKVPSREASRGKCHQRGRRSRRWLVGLQNSVQVLQELCGMCP